MRSIMGFVFGVATVALVGCAGESTEFGVVALGGSAGVPVAASVAGGASVAPSSAPVVGSTVVPVAPVAPVAAGGAPVVIAPVVTGGQGGASGSSVAGGASGLGGATVAGVACTDCTVAYNACSKVQSEAVAALSAACDAAELACATECDAAVSACWQGCADTWLGVNPTGYVTCKTACTKDACIAKPCSKPPAAQCAVGFSGVLTDALIANCDPALAECRAACT